MGVLFMWHWTYYNYTHIEVAPFLKKKKCKKEKWQLIPSRANKVFRTEIKSCRWVWVRGEQTVKTSKVWQKDYILLFNGSGLFALTKHYKKYSRWTTTRHVTIFEKRFQKTKVGQQCWNWDDSLELQLRTYLFVVWTILNFKTALTCPSL